MVDDRQALNDAVFANGHAGAMAAKEAELAAANLGDDARWAPRIGTSQDLRDFAPNYRPSDNANPLKEIVETDTLPLAHFGRTEVGIEFGIKDNFLKDHQYLQRKHNREAGLYISRKF